MLYSAFLLKVLTQAQIIFGTFRGGPHLFGRRIGVSVEPAILQTRDFQFQVVMVDVRHDHTCRQEKWSVTQIPASGFKFGSGYSLLHLLPVRLLNHSLYICSSLLTSHKRHTRRYFRKNEQCLSPYLNQRPMHKAARVGFYFELEYCIVYCVKAF